MARRSLTAQKKSQEVAIYDFCLSIQEMSNTILQPNFRKNQELTTLSILCFLIIRMNPAMIKGKLKICPMFINIPDSNDT